MHCGSRLDGSPSRGLRRLVATCAIVTAGWFWPSVALTQEFAIPGQNSLTDIEEIELVYAGSQPVPKITVRGRQAADSLARSSYHPPEEQLDLLAPSTVGQALGACRAAQVGTFPPLHVQADYPEVISCGWTWSLRRAGKSLDALSFRALHVRGVSSSPVTIEFRDASHGLQRTHAVVERVAGRFSLEIPLASLAKRLDLRQLTDVRLLVEEATDIVIEELVLLGPESESHPTPSLGFWYWDYRSAIRDPEGMVASCRRQHCRRILLQLPDARDSELIWNAYARLFAVAKSADINLFALDGTPDMIDHATSVIVKLDRLLALVGKEGIPGAQLDIEPYLLDGFPEDETIFDRYLDTIDRVKTALRGRAKLSAVIPFWFASTIHRQRPLAFSVMDLADEVAVMSYRTDVDELLAVSDDILRYGALEHVPVWLALETTTLLPERHVILKREQRGGLADGVLDPVRRTLTVWDPAQEKPPGNDRMWFRIHRRMTIRPERISFSGRTEHEVRQTITDLFTRIRRASFLGLLIHDLPGYLSLRR